MNLKLPFGTHTICPVLVVVLQLLDSLKFEISIEFANKIIKIVFHRTLNTFFEIIFRLIVDGG